MKKTIIIFAFIWGLPAAKAQIWKMNKITIHILDESIVLNAPYEIRRDKDFMSFIKILGPNGSISWGTEIVDSTHRGTYILNYHWITTFDSLQIRKDTIRLFNRTLDEIIYSR